MATFNISNNQFAETFTVNQQSGSYILLSTANKYLNKDIKINTNVKTGSLSLSGTANGSITSLSFNYNSTNGNFDVVGSGNVVGTTTATISDGWIAGNREGTINGTTSLSDVTVPKINIEATMSGTAKVTPTISKNSNTNVQTGTITTTKPNSGFYVAVSSGAKETTITATPSVQVGGDGYGTENYYTAANSTLNVGANASSVTYLPINVGGISISNTSANTNITGISFAYNSSTGKFGVSGSGSISGTTTVTITEGYVNSSTTGTSGSYSGTAQLSGVTVDKVEVTGALSGTTSALKPSISKQSTPSGIINAADGSATTTAPTSGSTRAYVAVRSAANTGSVTAVPSVTKAGYGTTSYYTAINSTAATVGAAQSDMTYVAIIQGTSQAGAGSISTAAYTTDGSNTGINVSSILTSKTSNTEPNDGSYYIAIKADGSGASNVKSAGWFNTGDLTSKTTTVTDYYKLQTALLTVSGGGLTAGDGTATASSDGFYDGTSYNTSDKVDITSQTSAANGYYKITVQGSGKVSRAAITKQITRQGYLPADANAVSQIAAENNYSSNTATKELFIKKSNWTGATASSSSTAQTITVPAGYYPTDRTVSISAMAATTVTTSYTQDNMGTYFDSQASASGASVTITPKYTNNSAGYLAAHTTATNNGGTGYWKIKTTSVSQGTSTISGTTVTRGTATWNTGWITGGSISAASFGNTPSNGVTYLDISGTTAAPILSTEDGYLYINKGYTDNLKISIGQLISSDITVSANDQILLGYTAYDAEGNILTGTIPNKNASDIVPSGNTLTIPWGKYEGTIGEHDAVTYTITSGDYSASAANTVAGTITPSVAINNASTYGFTTTKPSGTNGTNYLTIDPDASVTTKWKSTATATITTAGYIATGNKTATVEGTPSIAAGTNYYVPVVTPAFTAGTITASISSNTITTSMTTSSSSTSYYIDASAAGSASCTATKWNGTAKGVISVTSGTNAGSAPTSINNLSKSATRVYIPAATGSITMTAGSGSCSYNSSSSTNITVSDTNTSGVKIAFNGSGSVSAVAKTTVGYTPANNSYATGTSTSSNSTTGSKYVTGVNIRPPDRQNDTRQFSITVPNGSRSANDTITFVFTVDYNGNVTVAGPD